MKNLLKLISKTIFLTALTLWMTQTGLAQTFPGTGTGPIPDGVGDPNDGTTTCGSNLDVTFTVTGISSSLTSVIVSFTASHTWVGDLTVQLIAPDGTTHTILSRVGAVGTPDNGFFCNLGGTYTFTDSATGGIWGAAVGLGNNTNIPSGNYRTQVAGPQPTPPPEPAFTSLNAAFAGVPNNMISGTWILRFRDCAAGDLGTVSAASLNLIGTPTTVNLIAFNARAYENGTHLEWQTGYETGNIGFRLYCDDGGKRRRINNQLIAGTALIAGLGTKIQSGESYSWWDKSVNRSAQYWLEDIDLNGKSTWHGPFFAQSVVGSPTLRKNATLLANLTLNRSQSDMIREVERSANATNKDRPLAALVNLQQVVTSGQAIKIAVKHEGLYRITQPELVAAGFNTNIDPKTLQLLVDGVEVPISVNTSKGGRFDETSSIEFFGLGLDTPATDTHIYWLTSGAQPGRRIAVRHVDGIPTSQTSFTRTVEFKDRIIYFAALKNGEKENFFGSVVGNFNTDQALTLTNIDSTSSKSAELEIALQGISEVPHRVLIEVNGANIGFVIFEGQHHTRQKLNFEHSLLREGTNTIRLTSQNGATDLSLVDYLRLSYQHTFKADNNALKFLAIGREQVRVNGFTAKEIRVWDVTNPNSIEEIVGTLEEDKSGSYAVTVAAPGNGERRLLAQTSEQNKTSDLIRADRPSNLKGAVGGDLVIVTARDFLSEIESLKVARQAEGYKVAVVDIEDVYDEFNFGNKAPTAIKEFLSYARTNWQTKPRFVLLAGGATYDERNYFGFGEFDFIPTKLEETFYFETATDDWFVDFNNDGVPDLAVGRLPIRTQTEARVMIKKTLAYNSSPVKPSVSLVSDVNEGYNFEQANAELKPFFPANFKVEEIKRGELGTTLAKTKLQQALAEGRSLINYIGHGSIGLWRGNLLTAIEASQLSNKRLPMFILMTCLNGHFQDPENASLGTALLSADGGAAVIWASSGLTYSSEQKRMNQELYRLLFERKLNGKPMTIGEATVGAKRVVTDPDIRRTWILLGDPTLRFK